VDGQHVGVVERVLVLPQVDDFKEGGVGRVAIGGDAVLD
jgi:hypothetical protein